MYNTEDLGNSMMTMRYKIVFVGDINVGKTSVMNRFINNEFSGEYDVNKIRINIILIQATIGVDFATKTIEHNDNSIKLQIWDSAGQERYKALIPSYVRGSSIIFILYDISNRNTFNNITTWINFIKEVNTDNSFLVLCGNKIDLPRQVSTNEGKVLAEKEKMFFFETSAKNATGVNEMMYTCISKLPYFEDIKDKEKLRKELEEKNKNGETGIFDINIEKNNNANNPENPENSSHIILTKNISDDQKNGCSCQ